MKKIFNSIICLMIICVMTLCVMTLSSCKQKLCDWEYLGNSAKVEFDVDWSESNIDVSDIHNLSVYAYPEDGGAPYIRVSGDIESAYINLPSGIYSLLIFNDVVGDLAGIDFFDVNYFDKINAESIEQSESSNLYYNIEDGEVLLTPHDQLAAWRVDSFEVTSDMVVCLYCDEINSNEINNNEMGNFETLIEIAPTPITVQCIFHIRVENLNNAQIIQGVLKGFASGAYLSSQERISSDNNTNLYSVTFNSRTYDDSQSVDGDIYAEITTFGKETSTDQIYELEIVVILNSGEKVSYTRDITDQVSVQNNSVITIYLDSDDYLISLPEWQGTGFEVMGWGDKESIELL